MSGTALATAVAGSYLVYSGINDVSLLQGIRDIARGTLPKGKPSTGSTVVGERAAGAFVVTPTVGNVAGPATASQVAGPAFSGVGQSLVTAAKKYLGVPYRWGGSDPRTGLDCSGLVKLSFHDIGINDCPRTSATIHLWRKLRKVSTVTTGDILWWSGHVAIAVDTDTMIEAPTVGIPVRITKIRKGFTALRYMG
jgi:Cell wall-associated hydrolases (invasion-associated proteins)